MLRTSPLWFRQINVAIWPEYVDHAWCWSKTSSHWCLEAKSTHLDAKQRWWILTYNWHCLLDCVHSRYTYICWLLVNEGFLTFVQDVQSLPYERFDSLICRVLMWKRCLVSKCDWISCSVCPRYRRHSQVNGFRMWGRESLLLERLPL